MTVTTPRIGEHISIQYQVFRENCTPELQWYKGIIPALILNTGNSVQVTVRFDGSDSFPECSESFLLQDNNHLIRKGEMFPFKIEQGTQPSPQNNHECPIGQSAIDHPSSTSDKHRLSDIEYRIAKLEAQLSVHIPSIYLTLCTVLNKSLKKYRNKHHKIVGNVTDLVNDTWKLCHTCTLSDFKELLQYLQSLNSELTVTGDKETTTAPSEIALSFHSFHQFCTLFGISEFNYNSLLSCSKFNRKGNLLSFKCIGSYIDNMHDPARPSMLCVGGRPCRWSEQNFFFYKENSHRLNSGSPVCSFQQVKTIQSHATIVGKIGSSIPRDIIVKWVQDESAEICRPIHGTSTFVGTIDLQLPYTHFNNLKEATQIHKWLSPNRTISYSSDGSDSSDCSSL